MFARLFRHAAAAAFLAMLAGVASAQAVKVRLVLPAVSVLFAPVYIAEDAGYFKEAGLDVDLSLLASTLLTPGTSLWTLDRRLGALAARLGDAERLLHGPVRVRRTDDALLGQHPQHEVAPLQRAFRLAARVVI